jgi:uncharacterized LabA/DUF88 family protein
MPVNTPLRTSVYIDGFNLYYGQLKNSPYKWLDLSSLFRLYLDTDNNKIESIKYFTAKVKSRPTDPAQHIRQELYLRALRTIPNLEIIYGHFLSHVIKMPLADGTGTVEVIKTEEKKSDVNLAVNMLHDAHLNRYDLAVLVSNDSDLEEPVRIVTKELGKKVGILNPQKKFSNMLTQYALFKKSIRTNVLAQCQFPEKMTDSRGTFQKPKEW